MLNSVLIVFSFYLKFIIFSYNIMEPISVWIKLLQQLDGLNSTTSCPLKWEATVQVYNLPL